MSIKTFRLELSVNYDYSWREATNRGAPKTDIKSDFAKVRLLDKWFPVFMSGVVKERVIVVNFGREVEANEVLAYGSRKKSLIVNPRTLLAIAECFPELSKQRGLNCLDLVTVSPCQFHGLRVPCLSYDCDGGRSVDLGWFDAPFDAGFSFVFYDPKFLKKLSK